MLVNSLDLLRLRNHNSNPYKQRCKLGNNYLLPKCLHMQHCLLLKRHIKAHLLKLMQQLKHLKITIIIKFLSLLKDCLVLIQEK